MLQTLKTQALTSRKFLVWLATAIIAFGNALLARVAPGYEMDQAVVWQLVAAAAAYTVGQGVADHGATAAAGQVKIAAAQAMDSGPEKSAALKSLAGIAPANDQAVAAKAA